MRRQSGFTLIELLVVIGILSTLFVVLLSQIASSQETADEFACRANLKNIYQAIQNHKAKKNRLPSGGGTQFLWRIWRSLEPTKQNRDMFFCPEVASTGQHADIKEIPLEELWRSADDFTSEDTDYAARASNYRKGMMRGNQIIVADDNEGGRNHRAGTVNVLYGDGKVESLLRDDLQEKGLWPADDPDFVLLVGPESPHPDLQKLSKH